MAAVAPSMGEALAQPTSSGKPPMTTVASPAVKGQPKQAKQKGTEFHHGKIVATTGTVQQRSMEGTGPTTLLRGTMLVCMRMACAPFPGHSLIGLVCCHVFYLLALVSRCMIGTPEPGAAVDLEIPSISHMSPGQYAGLLLACVQALAVGAICSDEAFENNRWGGLGIFAAFLGLVWIVLRNVPSSTTDVADLGASTAASTMTFTLVLEILACVGPDLLLFTSDAKAVFGSAGDSILPAVLLLSVGVLCVFCVFVIYANQSGSSFGVDVSNEEEDWVLKRVLRNVSGLLFISLLLALGIIGLAAPFVSLRSNDASLTASVQNPTETPAKLGSMIVIILSDIGLAVLQTCLLPRCRWGACGTSPGVVVSIDAGSP